jgi:hypothetical protein
MSTWAATYNIVFCLFPALKYALYKPAVRFVNTLGLPDWPGRHNGWLTFASPSAVLADKGRRMFLEWMGPQY